MNNPETQEYLEAEQDRINKIKENILNELRAEDKEKFKIVEECVKKLTDNNINFHLFGEERTNDYIEPKISNSRKYPKEDHFLISPTGEKFFLWNVSKFCRENNLSRDGIKRLIYGKLLNYKGWIKAKI